MKKRILAALLAVSMQVSMLPNIMALEPSQEPSSQAENGGGQYNATWDSVNQHNPAPEWLMDGKFGIYAHWGVYSVPAFHSEWYPREMYFDGTQETYDKGANVGGYTVGYPSSDYTHHLNTYGDPKTEFPYHNFIIGGEDLEGNEVKFNPSGFNAEEWAELFAASGAQWAGPVFEHHDGVSMWDSEVNEWNTYDLYGVDVVGALADAIRDQGLKFAGSVHQAYNYNGYFEFAPEYEGTVDVKMYNGETKALSLPKLYGQLDTEVEDQLWLDKLEELIDKYSPDLIYHDWGIDDLWFLNGDGVPEDKQLEFLAYYFNNAEEKGKEVVVTYKDGFSASGAAGDSECCVLDYERSNASTIAEQTYITDESVNATSWCYTEGMSYYSANALIDTLFDRISKNGVMMLNIAPMADGSIPEEQQQILRSMGAFLDKYGEAVYATRAWETYGEGPTEHIVTAQEGTSSDFRFTRSKDSTKLYATALDWPSDNKLTITTLNSNMFNLSNLESIQLVDGNVELTYTQDQDGLHINLPADYAGAAELEAVSVKLDFGEETIPSLIDQSVYYTLAPVISSDYALNYVDSTMNVDVINTTVNVPTAYNQWKFTEVEDGYYKITPRADETLALTTASTELQDGTNVIVASYTGADTQLWKAAFGYGGTLILTSKLNPNMCLLESDPSISDHDNVNVWINDQYERNRKEWNLYRVNDITLEVSSEVFMPGMTIQVAVYDENAESYIDNATYTVNPADAGTVENGVLTVSDSFAGDRFTITASDEGRTSVPVAVKKATLAAIAQATASSQWDASNNAQYVLDGKMETRWAAAAGTADNWLALSNLNGSTITQIVVHEFGGADTQTVTRTGPITLQVQNAEGEWESVANVEDVMTDTFNGNYGSYSWNGFGWVSNGKYLETIHTFTLPENFTAHAIRLWMPNSTEPSIFDVELEGDVQIGGDAQVESVQVTPTNATVRVDKKVTLSAQVRPSYAADQTVTWESKNPEIATVDQNGVVTGVSEGRATIIATAGGKSASCIVTVLESELNGKVPVDVDHYKPTCYGWSSHAYENEGFGWWSAIDGKLEENAGWHTSEGVTDAYYTIRFREKGDSDESYNHDSGPESYYIAGVTLYPRTSYDSVRAFAKDVEIYVSDTAPAYANVPTGSAGDYVPGDGAVNPETLGTLVTSTTLEAPTDGGCYIAFPSLAKGSYVTIHVKNIQSNELSYINVSDIVLDVYEDDLSVKGVSLDRTSLRLTPEATRQLTATITPANAENQNVTWKSDNDAIATVTQNGLVTAVANGTTTITVTTEDGQKTATCTVTVSDVATAGDHIYVATTGSDDNIGTEDAPVATLQKAAELARQEDGAVTITVGEGKYFMDEALNLTSEDSNVSWVADGEVILTGAEDLGKLSWTEYKNGIYVADVPAGLAIDQLFVGGEQQIQARYPNYNADQPLQGCTSFADIKARVAGYSDPTTGYIRALHWHLWGGMSFEITGKDNSSAIGLSFQWVGDNNRMDGADPNTTAGIRDGRVMVENIFEELDAPKEWFYDSENGKLYFYPEDVNDLNLTMEGAVTEELIHIEGIEDGAQATDITFDGFILENTARTMFTGTYVPLMRGDWCVVRSGALFMENAENITFQNGEIRNIGGNAVFMSGHNKNNTIYNNEIYNIGSSGVQVVGDPDSCREPSFWELYGNLTPEAEDYYIHKTDVTDTEVGPIKEHYPVDCTIEQNHIENVGIWEKQSSQVNISVASRIKVLHNTINHGPRAGINICDGTFGGHELAYNDIFDVQLETDDHGMFNSWGRDRFWTVGGFDTQGTKGALKEPYSLLDCYQTIKIHDNRMHFGGRLDGGTTFGIDLDDGSSNYEIYNNLCLNMGLKLREGFHRTVYNNIFVNGQINLHCTYEDSYDKIYSNIVIKGNPYALAATDQNRFAVSEDEIDKNCFYDLGAAITLPDFWDAVGYDQNSIKGGMDPEFADAAHNDYTVQNETLMEQIGFENFSMTQFGQTGCEDQAPYYEKTEPDSNTDIRQEENWNGATICALDDALMTASSNGSLNGVYLLEVPEDSLAYEYGFRTDDVMQSVNGEKIGHKSTFHPMYAEVQPGQTVTINVRRSGQYMDLTFVRKDTIEMVDDTDSAVKFTGSWDAQANVANTANAYNRTFHACDNTQGQNGNAAVELTFTGNSVSVLGRKEAAAVIYNVVITDASGQELLTTKADATEGTYGDQQTIYTWEAETMGTYTIRLTPASNGWAVVDAFRVTGRISDNAKENLQVSIDQAEALGTVNTGYLPADWADMQEKLQAAKDVFADPAATDEEIYQAKSELDAALKNLRKCLTDSEMTFIPSTTTRGDYFEVYDTEGNLDGGNKDAGNGQWMVRSNQCDTIFQGAYMELYGTFTSFTVTGYDKYDTADYVVEVTDLETNETKTYEANITREHGTGVTGELMDTCVIENLSGTPQRIRIIHNDNYADGDRYLELHEISYTCAPMAGVVSVTGVTLDKTSAALEIGDELTLTATVAPTDATNKTVTWSSDDTTVATVTDGVVTAKESGTATITVTTVDGGYTATCKITVDENDSGGSTSSGGSSSGNKTETTTNPDGSTTTTVTKPDGSTTETTKAPDGSSSVVHTDKNGRVEANVIVSNSAIENADGVVALPMPAVSATMDAENAPSITVDLPAGSTVKVEIPVADVTAGTVAILVKADGSEEIIKTSVPTEDGVAVTLKDGDTVKIVDNSKDFSDVPSGFWGADAVAFASSRELFNGTSETAFSPNADMNRAMIVTVLARLEGVDTSDGDTWYEAGQEWAMENGISDGSNMMGSLTREQLATMLYRYVGSPAVSGEIAGFTDTADVSDWAEKAMLWAVQNGIISGSGNKLNPQGDATRAQVATMLMRFVALQ